MRKLSNKDVEDIYMSTKPQKDLAEKYNVSITTISTILSGKLHKNETWKLKQPKRKKYHKKLSLSDEQARSIYLSEDTTKNIAEQYGICRMTVSRIKNREYYQHVTKDLPDMKKHYRLHRIDVIDIYLDERPSIEIAWEYNISVTTVRNIKNGVTHKKVIKELQEEEREMLTL